MNNLVFGNESFGYYETICGGAGATQTGNGASAVHTHMTNTRITDVEVMEQRYPVRVKKFALRNDSGAEGAHCGGAGVIREIEFLEPVSVCILSQRRTRAPFGLNGGSPGQPGLNLLNGRDIGPLAQFDARPGDILTIHTPGGGGFGKNMIVNEKKNRS
jgi:5-oxoprolinase (ATP-hydrolysing)